MGAAEPPVDKLEHRGDVLFTEPVSDGVAFFVATSTVAA
jgi:hypothetical protein